MYELSIICTLLWNKDIWTLIIVLKCIQKDIGIWDIFHKPKQFVYIVSKLIIYIYILHRMSYFL